MYAKSCIRLSAAWLFIATISVIGVGSRASAALRPSHSPAADGVQSAEYDESQLLGRIRQLTYAGRRAGEGYFSPDGTHLILQSERDSENPFYQIYNLDLTTGDASRVSPGFGKTTCSFFQAGTGTVMFASTHHDPRSRELQQNELDLRASGQERRYAFDYDPEFDIYIAPGPAVAAAAPDGEVDPASLLRLTDTRGYDAEGSMSPDGEWIVFASNRDAYNRELSEAGQAQLEIDPSYFMEIYIMRPDGSGQRRLTEVPGYDGGPFFSPDGSRIVWRRFTEDGLMADVWTMNPDGSDQYRVTNFGALSWAPYLHPSGEYIFFASNKLGFTNFEVYIVDTAGRKEPVRVTTTDGFDALPVPSPDGAMLAWTSSRNSDGGRGSGQIFIANWNHERALELIAAAPPQKATRGHVEFLASDDLGGRLVGSEGAHRAAEYIAGQLREIGAQPLPGHEGFHLPFEFSAGLNDAGSSVRLTIDGTEKPFPADDIDVRALSFSDSGEVNGPVIFAGYGITVPNGQNYPYDSFATLDVEDKIVVVLRYIPDDVEPDDRAILSRYSDIRYKAMRARELGAEALVVITGPRSPNAGELVPMTFDTAVAGSGIVAASVSGEIAAALFATLSDKLLAAVQEELDTGNPHVVGFDFPGVEMALDVKIERERRTGYNVAGYLPAADTDADGVVVLGAHYDHLGRGRGGGSLARDGEAGQIHNGADDNASGVAAVLEAGAQLAAMSHSRGVVLAFWSGEELDLLGAKAFVGAPVIPAHHIAAYINFDMVGRARDNVLNVQAVGSSAAWPALIERTNVPVGFDLRLQDDPYLPTDSLAFNTAGVPTLSFFTGSHEDYHRPTDDADLINYDDLERVARFGALLARRVANLEEAPEFVAVARTAAQTGSRDTVRVFTGTIPDYASDIEGLLLGGVIEGGPAAKAGLRGGDVIVEFAGQKITNIYDYTFALDSAKVDVKIAIVYIRGGERYETELTPTARR